MGVSTAPTEVALLNRLIRPERNGLSAAAARSILAIDFDADDRARMRELSAKARAGTLSAKEKAEIESYERVGHIIDLLHSKARCSLKLARRGRPAHG